MTPAGRADVTSAMRCGTCKVWHDTFGNIGLACIKLKVVPLSGLLWVANHSDFDYGEGHRFCGFFVGGVSAGKKIQVQPQIRRRDCFSHKIISFGQIDTQRDCK